MGAVVIIGGNFEGRDQTLASGLIDQFNYSGNQPLATAIAIMLLAVIRRDGRRADPDSAAHGRDPAALPDGVKCI